MSLLHHPEEEVVLSSPIEGKLTYKNQPAGGAKVIRLIKWQDETGDKDYVLSDKDGYFKLPAVKVKTQLSKLAQFALSVEISVIYQDQKYVVWVLGNRSKELYGELGGVPENFRCELTDEDTPLRLENAFLLTKCKWDKIIPKKGE